MSGGGKTIERTESKLPKWLRPHIEGMAVKSAKLANKKFKPFEGEAVLRKNRMEREAQTGIQQMYDAGERSEHGKGVSSLDAASRAYANTPMWDESQFEKYSSPYFKNVVNIEKREASRDAAMLAKNLRSNAVGAGAFGGSREAIMQSGLQRNLLQNLGDIEHKGRQSAWDSALTAFGADREAMRLAANGQSEVAAQYMNFAKQGQDQQFQRIAALAQSGASDRELEQAAVDFAIRQHEAEQQWERNILASHAANLRGIPTVQIGTGYKETQTPPPSPLSTIMGAVGGIAGVMSDRNTKKNILEVGSSPSGIPLYEFEYKEGDGSVFHGVMAQDILGSHPDAVHVNDEGTYMVLYSTIDADFYRVR
tara:strand:- start:94 stop:1191 length:1098 start_codon:yes stop_codon:yes gene_type:complete